MCRLCQLLRRVLNALCPPLRSDAPAVTPEPPPMPSSPKVPLKRDSKSYLEWTIEDWMEDEWDRRDVEYMRDRWPGISDEEIIRQLRQN